MEIKISLLFTRNCVMLNLEFVDRKNTFTVSNMNFIAK